MYMSDSQLIRDFGAIVEYLNDLSPSSVIFFSDKLLPASKEQIKLSAVKLRILSKDEKEKHALEQVPTLLEQFLPHDEAIKILQLSKLL
jgi:hypothetical protein